MRVLATRLVAAACVATFASTSGSAGQARAPATYMYILMVNMVGPPATFLWQTVARRPLSEGEWQRLKQEITRLSDSAAAVSTGGNSNEEAERAKSPEWKNWSGKFTDAVSTVAQAAEHKDQTALVAAADALRKACEGCHTSFPIAATQ